MTEKNITVNGVMMVPVVSVMRNHSLSQKEVRRLLRDNNIPYRTKEMYGFGGMQRLFYVPSKLCSVARKMLKASVYWANAVEYLE